MQRANELLLQRVTDLDTAPVRLGHEGICSLMLQFVDVIHLYTNTFMDGELGAEAHIDPEAADAIVAPSRLLAQIAEQEASLTGGPLRVDCQRWTRTGKFNESAIPARKPPTRNEFVKPAPRPGRYNDVTPFDLGLYTSTATAPGWSMWQAYLESYRGSMLYPEPWYTWELQPDGDEVAVAEIVSATTWVEFVCAHGHGDGVSLVPDWAEVARKFDAVHVTLPAIVAAQGFHFKTPGGLIPPEFWDVESTLWLRWRFSGARLVDIVSGEQDSDFWPGARTPPTAPGL